MQDKTNPPIGVTADTLEELEVILNQLRPERDTTVKWCPFCGDHEHPTRGCMG